MAKSKSTTEKIEKSRDDFSPETVAILGKRASFICSNPYCRTLTIAASIADNNKFIYDGIASHITAAAEGGPRYNADLTPEQRMDETNGIFLCGTCSIMIDKNKGIDYPVTLLNEWKEQHTKWVNDWLNKKINPLVSSPTSIEVKIEIQHDRNIFLKLNQILPEDDLRTIIDNLQTYMKFFSGDMPRIHQYYDTISKTENQFIDNDLKTEANSLAKELRALHTYTAGSFFIFPNYKIDDHYQYCLYPDNDTERNSDDFSDKNIKFFDGEIDKLNALSNTVLEQFEKFRQVIKTKIIL